jgi:hypothetical protein
LTDSAQLGGARQPGRDGEAIALEQPAVGDVRVGAKGNGLQRPETPRDRELKQRLRRQPQVGDR